MNIEMSNRDCSNWITGHIVRSGFTFEAKVFDEPSIYGIPTPRFEDGGNVSKLHIRDESGKDFYSYDRGLDFVADDGALAVASEIVLALEDVFCKAGE